MKGGGDARLFTYLTLLVCANFFGIAQAFGGLRLVSSVIASGGVVTSSPPVAGASMIVDMSLGEAFVGPDSQQSPQGFMASNQTRAYLGFYSGIDPVVPGAIADLTVSTGITPDQANLTWTAPGDDVFVGQAMAYEVRMATFELTASNFDSGTLIASLLLPSPAGSREYLRASSLPAGPFVFFAVKALDELYNASF